MNPRSKSKVARNPHQNSSLIKLLKCGYVEYVFLSLVLNTYYLNKIISSYFMKNAFLWLIIKLLVPLAFVLINCELGSEQSVIGQLKQIEPVKEVSGTFGSYDILAKIECPNNHELNSVITNKIRNLEMVKGTLTLMGIDRQR